MPTKKLNILVLLREVSDHRPPAKTITRGAGIKERGLRRIPNGADLIALEEGLRLKDKYGATVTVICIGRKNLDDTLRLAASVGADRLIRLWDHALDGGDAAADGKILGRVLDILKPDLFFSGNRTSDRGDDPIPALASARSSRVCVNSAVAFTIKNDSVEILRKVDRGGRQEVVSPLPCTILFDGGEELRYPSVNDLTCALEASIDCWDLSDLGLPFWEVGAIGSKLVSAEFGTPRPDPLRLVTPDGKLPAFERILSLLSGGIKSRQGKIYQETAEITAEKLWHIFETEGVVPGVVI